jgi:CRISPR system Cascade subunit CasA
MHLNILADRLIRIQTDSVIGDASLAEVLVALSQDRVDGFPALAPHQAHSWHAFLVQIAGLALHRVEASAIPDDAGAWATLLRGLTAGFPQDEPWHLIVEDLTKPAFLQPPIPEGNPKSLNNEIAEPDRLDVLVTSKNHDVKGARVSAPEPDHWLFALVSLQTMEGFLGAGNYGIARMNGGFASRPCVSLVPGPRPGQRFRRDLAVLLRTREKLLADYPDFLTKGNCTLLWLEPWNGTSQLELAELDPWFIEICRRVRLIGRWPKLVAHTGNSKAARIAAKERSGDVADPWTPIHREGKALTVGAGGFHYALLQEVLFGEDFRPSVMQRLYDGIDGAEVWVLARALARGQGETNGYHERLLPVPAQAQVYFFDLAARASLGEIARIRVEEAGKKMRSRVLRPALLAYCGRSEWAEPWLIRFDQRVDAIFFRSLWGEASAQDSAKEGHHREWLDEIAHIARRILDEAMAGLPSNEARRYRAIAGAEGMFLGCLLKQFPQMKVRAAA